MRALETAKTHGKFTDAYTTVMRDAIKDYVEEHHSGDTKPARPDDVDRHQYSPESVSDEHVRHSPHDCDLNHWADG